MSADKQLPAFPTPLHNIRNDGMTLRDYFAIHALQMGVESWKDYFLHDEGAIADYGKPTNLFFHKHAFELIADYAYKFADAMLEAREE